MSLNWISWPCSERPRGLDVVLELLGARRWRRICRCMAIAQMRRATRPMTVYSGSMPLEKKKERLGAKLVDLHAAREVVLDVGETVGQREGQLGDRVGARLGDVVAARWRPSRSCAPCCSMKYCWMSPIIFRANSIEKMQVFWPWSSLRMSAWTVPRTLGRHLGPDLLILGVVRARGRSSAANFSTCWSMAVLRNMASMIGAGPLMVMETELLGAQRSKPP